MGRFQTAETALQVAATVDDDTDRQVIVDALRLLARETVKLREALVAHRGVIVAIDPDGAGDEKVDRLGTTWPM